MSVCGGFWIEAGAQTRVGPVREALKNTPSSWLSARYPADSGHLEDHIGRVSLFGSVHAL